MKLIKRSVILLSVYLALFLVAFFSGELSDGVRRGIDLCLELLIPSMFVFLILSNLLMTTSAAQIMARPFRRPAERCFRIPESGMVILLLSLVGGYPVGAKLLADAVRKGQMPPQTAERMLAYCVNCGPAFLISGVGVRLFGNITLGVVLYLSQIAACVTVGILSSRGSRTPLPAESAPPSSAEGRGISTRLVEAVNGAARSMGVICIFVVAFSALLPIVSLFLAHLPGDAALLLRGLLEVTSGCGELSAVESLNPILLAALFTSFGGVCVILQLCAMLRGTGISLKRFFLWRIPYILISLLLTRLCLRFLPGVSPTMSLDRRMTPQLYSVSPVSTIFLVLLCIMLLFFSGKSAKIKEKPVS